MSGNVPVKDNLPWVEKYRPKGLDELISHADIIRIIEKYLVDRDALPNLLFFGPPGTGKRSTILAFAKKKYCSDELNNMVLELNGSDDGGVGIVGGVILKFARTGTNLKGGFKIVILDEADGMTKDAQNALCRIIEKLKENVRVCIICNNLSKIIPTLQSRCTRFRFAPLNEGQILPRLNYVIEQEKIKVTEDGKQALLTVAKGNMRKILNVLESVSKEYEEVNEENVSVCTGYPLKADIVECINWMLHKDFSSAYSKIMDLKTEKGFAATDILTEIHSYVHQLQLTSEKRIHLLCKMADIEHRVSLGTSENVQLSSLVSVFQEIADNEVE